MSKDTIWAWWGKYWTLALQILTLVALAGVSWAKIPTKDDVSGWMKGPDNPYIADKGEIVTKDDVLALIRGPDNPYVPNEPLIMRIVGRYDRDQEQIIGTLTDIQVKIGLLLDRGDKKGRK